MKVVKEIVEGILVLDASYVGFSLLRDYVKDNFALRMRMSFTNFMHHYNK